MTDLHTKRPHRQDDGLSRSDRLLKAIGRLAANVVDTPPKTLFASLLDEVLDVTDSEYGYIGEVLQDDGVPYLKTWAITDISWNAETRDMYRRFAVEGDGMEFRNLETLFGWGLREGGRIVIANDVAADERSAGRPDRHPALVSYLGVPLRSGGALVGQLGLANRPDGFDDDLLEHLEPLLQVMTNLLVAHRTSTSAAATETELSVLLGALRSGVLFTDEDRRIVFANQRLCDLLGIDATPAELVGRLAGPGHTVELGEGRTVRPSPDVFGDAFADIQCVQDGDEPRIVEITGTDRVLERACRPVEFPNRHRTGALYIYHDVTEKAVLDRERESLLEREREQRRLAEDSNRSLLELDRLKNEFVASVSHELRTPLSSIASYTELILDGPLDPGQREHLTVVHRNAAQLSRLVDDLLLIARIESGSLEIEQSLVSLSDVVRGVATSFAPTIDANGLDLVLDLSDEEPPAFIDELRVDQVIRNLMSNATKFTPRAGRIEVSTRRVAGAWELTIEDSGIGIPPDEIDRLFDRFYRATNARASELPGSGLGLSIVAAIVDRHGGSLRVTSPGSGTTVAVLLPDETR